MASTKSNSRHPLLSPEELAAHAQTCQVIFAMWAGQGELLIEAADDTAVQQVRIHAVPSTVAH